MKPPVTIHNVAEWQNNCRRIHATAQALLGGKLTVIEAARQLAVLAHHVHLHADEDLEAFVAIDSETDTLPIGDVRQYWEPNALKRQDAEIAHAERLYEAIAGEAAARLVERFAWALEARRDRRKRGGAA